jgi:hypothetical protein
MYDYVSLDGRLKAIKIVFPLIVAISIIAAISDASEISLLNRVIANEDVSEATLNANDSRQAVIGLAQFVLYVAGAVVFIRWLRQGYRNIDAIRAGTRRYGHGWAIWGWFVPFLNLWRPKEIINDVWRAGGTQPPALLAWWWAAFLITGWLGNIAVRAGFSDDTPEDIRTGSIAYLVSDLVDAVAAVLAIFVAIAVTRRVERARELHPPEPEVRFDLPPSEQPVDLTK